jgi:hypothetical protein
MSNDIAVIVDPADPDFLPRIAGKVRVCALP